MSDIAKAIDKAIREHVVADMPVRIRDLSNMAWADLMFGPYSAADYAEESPERETAWPGYQTAVRELREWADETIPRVLWVDTDADCVMATRPSSGYVDDDGNWIEDDWSEIYEVDRGDIMRAIFGDLVNNGL